MNNKKQISLAEKKEKSMPAVGIVANCINLKVRTGPSKDDDVLTMLDKCDKVKIDEKLSTNDFYYVTVSRNNESEVYSGFCMKEYISIEK